ncbi:MAG: hypothetical protein A3G33_10890 [Omnitrophica bacterium RIFCSPLOWO2_12_FULL_44_17]|uniref:Ice-binding protein C-terminal domain-containing protein n=1 Tax=Candidatus Danuiimicrobium aquiferis TaxID=1801832 RepID=A0A1G1KRM6_9BACT|nr:MAG: hypothetical protein A3B72_03210 [Omnitrophica bacterium RIFCSPHIGHO2_02_FULL_45_28]OGW88652.1 MAG: hypothetical protein A3E74_05955 [Omnitrophica bacterium RIFCSPHIGHO2_12_FULL_44_12]OGW95475.1 MAG: hypothetical protein A3G33_10890 [Omnitrophica bacterium RIFCSPLOWO2_12_FULL_44_17]OGX03354.1 MAG: hypothetical protein A3J12_07530 [Omnitrophica bacterium RIFCSPLOWO2_02_FULL_44_11]
MNRIKKGFTIAIAFILLQFPAMTSAFAVVLPDPNQIVDGLPIYQAYDEFISHSTQLLTQFGFSGFNGPAGVGGLDVVLLTNAGGIDNDPVNGGFTFEDPAPSSTGGTSTFSGTWGQGDGANGPVLVDMLIAYLHNQLGPTANIPVFTFDLAEPGNAATRDLKIVANFQVWNPNTNSEVASWSLDGVNNGIFDPTAFITVQGEIQLTGASTTVYQANNTGSGAYDFLVYAPTMDLSAYTGQGYEFHIFSEMKDLNGSKEESFLSGTFTTPTPPDPAVPEPSTIALMMMGLAGAFLRGHKRFR